MSAIINTSSTLPRPYIGSCRNRNYISNKPSSLFNDYYFSTIQSSKSFLPNRFRQKIYFSTTNDFHERLPIKYSSSFIQLNKRQLNQEEKAKDFLSSTSSSLFLFPTITPLTYYDRYSSSSSIKEQPKPICNLHNSHSSSSLLNDSLVINNDKIHQSTRLTSTPIRPLISSEILTNNNHNNMSSLRNSSIINSNTHSYDQRISDQGNKYLIQIKTDDYQEDEFLLTVHYSPNQLIIDAKHNEEDSLGGFIRRELHKIFPIPIHIDLNKYTYSYNKNTQELTIEMPYLPTKPDASFISPIQNSSQSLTFSYDNLNLTNGGNLLPPIYSQSDHHQNSNNTSEISTAKNESSIPSTKPFDFDLFHRSAFRPQIIPTTTNENKLLMSLDLSDYQPEDIKISIQDQELIVKAERNTQTDTKKSRSSFFQSTSLPPQTDIEHVQSNYIDGKLIIEAPYLDRQNSTNEQTVIKSQKETIDNDPYQQRTETVIEFVRRRRF